jgi:hypothetical protein
VANKPLLEAVAMLEARDWRGAHAIVQDDDTPLAFWAHGIVHLIEGDETNARYWYRLAGRTFPGMGAIDAEIAALKGNLKKNG